jgi:hypothetical protein
MNCRQYGIPGTHTAPQLAPSPDKVPYIREEELGDRLGKILKDIHIPHDILAQLQKPLLNDKGREEEVRRQQGERLAQRQSEVHRRMDEAYQDKLDGKISGEFWMRKSGEWQAGRSLLAQG